VAEHEVKTNNIVATTAKHNKSFFILLN